MTLYNAFIAFVIVGIAFVIGDIVSEKTHAWVPSVFVTAVLFLAGYWTVMPKTIGTDSGMVPFAGTIAIFMFIVHIGTVISLKQLIEQWRTVVVCLVGLAGMVILGYFIGKAVMPRELVIAGIPPLTGGIVAALTMQQAATAAGLKEAAVFAIAMYCVQGFAGYPLTALCLHREGTKLLKEWRSGSVHLTEEEKAKMRTIGLDKIADESDVNKPLHLPDWMCTPMMTLIKIAFTAWCASLMGQLIPQVPAIVWALIVSVIFTRIGILDSSSLTRANSFQIVMFAAMVVVFDGLKDCTPGMLKNLLVPMIVLILIGVFGMAAAAFVISKILKMSFPLAFANGLTALYGFPCDAIITTDTCKSLTQDEDERGYLMSKMFPSMVVGGFVTVTITSVVLAGAFAKLL